MKTAKDVAVKILDLWESDKDVLDLHVKVLELCNDLVGKTHFRVMDTEYFASLPKDLATRADYLRTCEYTLETDVEDLDFILVPSFNGFRIRGARAKTEEQAHANLKEWLEGFPTNKE